MVVNFPVCADDPYRIDTEAAKLLLAQYRPEFVIFGKSMVLYKEPVTELVSFIREQGIRTTVMYDMAHVLGLIGDPTSRSRLRRARRSSPARRTRPSSARSAA